MKVFGLKLSSWKGSTYYWRETNERQNNLSSTNSFVQIVPTHLIVGVNRKRVEFAHKLLFLRKIFYQQYSEEFINKLEVKELKNLIDKFLLNSERFKAFL